MCAPKILLRFPTFIRTRSSVTRKTTCPRSGITRKSFCLNSFVARPNRKKSKAKGDMQRYEGVGHRRPRSLPRNLKRALVASRCEVVGEGTSGHGALDLAS